MTSNQNKNYIRLNAKDAIERSKIQREKNVGELKNYTAEIKLGQMNETHKNFGNVPSQLQKRIDAAKKAKTDAILEKKQNDACPPGQRIMPEDERILTLEGLQTSLSETRAEYAAQRISADNISAIKRRENLETKMVELNKALEVFSKKIVYVQTNK